MHEAAPRTAPAALERGGLGTGDGRGPVGGGDPEPGARPAGEDGAPGAPPAEGAGRDDAEDAPGAQSPPGPAPSAPGPEEAAAAEALAPALTFAEACAALAVTPYVLRRVMDEYEDALPPLLEAGAERRVPAAAMAALGAVVGWRNGGLAPAAIRERLRGWPAAHGGPADAAPATGAPTLDRLVGEVAALQEQLQRSEQRQAEDRDRLLTALMRTNQELQHLRHEVAARSRRDRRRGFWGRLFG